MYVERKIFFDNSTRALLISPFGVIVYGHALVFYFSNMFFSTSDRPGWCFCKWWHVRAILIADTGSNGHVINECLVKSQKKKKNVTIWFFFNNINTLAYCLGDKWEARFVRSELFLFRAGPRDGDRKNVPSAIIQWCEGTGSSNKTLIR